MKLYVKGIEARQYEADIILPKNTTATLNKADMYYADYKWLYFEDDKVVYK